MASQIWLVGNRRHWFVQVGRSIAAKTLEDEDAEFEVDPLASWEPVEDIPHVFGDRVELPFSHGKTSRRTQYRLQLVQKFLVDAGKQAITVVQPACDKGVDQSYTRLRWERVSNDAELAKLVARWTTHPLYVVAHRQPTVDQHSKVVHRGLEGQCAASRSDGVDHNFLKLPRTAQPDELGFFGIELQSVWRHPFVDLGDADCHLGNHWIGISRLVGDVQLTIVSVTVDSKTMIRRYDWDIRCVQQEQEWTEYTSLRNARC